MRFLKIVYIMGIAAAIIALVIAGVEAFYPGSWQYSETNVMYVFFVVLPLGLVLTVVGTFLRQRTNVFGAGLILGGIGTMIYAIVPYQLNSVLRFAGIAVVLAILIFVGRRVFSLSRS